MDEAKMDCRSQLETLGVKCGEMGLAITKHIAEGTTEIDGKTFKFWLAERLGRGIQIRREGKEEICLITYEAMLKMANAMGLFDDNEEENNG